MVVRVRMRVDPIGLADACATAEAFEVEVLRALERAVGFEAAFFMVAGCEDSISALGLDADARVKIGCRAEAYARELLPVKQAALVARGVAVDTEVCGETKVRSTSYYREIVSKLNGRHSLVAYVPWRGRVVAAMMLGRKGKGFSAHEISVVEALLPAVGVTRAAYGLPRVFDPLPAPPSTHLFGRLLGARGSRVLASVSTLSGDIVVRDRAGYREMVACNGASELVWTRVALDDPRRSGWPYVELLHLAPALARQRRRALFIGSGGAVGVRQFAAAYPGMAIDVVECEPEVVELARTWFDLGKIPDVTVYLAEGTAFIRAAQPGTWDVVVIDAYDASQFDRQFSNKAFMVKLRSVLRPGGAVACNVIGSLAGSSAVSTFVAAASAQFEQVRVVPVVARGERYAADTLRNVVVVAVRGD